MKSKPLPASQSQSLLPLTVAKEVEIDGIQMGVMSDGTAYLTGRGLAAICDVVHSVIQDMTNGWEGEQAKPRGRAISNLLQDRGYDGPLFHRLEVNGSTHFAYPDIVCTAILEYYAFETKPPRDLAVKNFRRLANSSLRAFIYLQVGYDPSNQIPQSWKAFHDRVSLNHHTVPDGYFSVFKELADMCVSLIQQGIPIDQKTVPDISVGISWASHWKNENLELTHGKSIRYSHNYPDYFPQAASNPQACWAYPEAALPAFRKWMRDTYIKVKFPTYLQNQEKRRFLPPAVVKLALKAVSVERPQIGK